MNTYDVVLRSNAGLLRSVQVEATDEAMAHTEAGNGGWQVLSCERRAPAATQAVRQRRRRAIDVVAFAHEFSSLLSAGLSVPLAIQTLAGAGKAAGGGDELTEVARVVMEGQTLSAAMDRQQGRFPALLVATVRASEQTGNLSEALQRYAEHQQRLRALRDKVTGAAIYPALLLGLGGLVVLFLLGVVVPRFATLIETTRQELPWTSRLMMSWGQLVARHANTAVAIAVVFVVSLVGGLRHLVTTGARARWVEALPLVGPMIREFRHAQLYRTTGMLVHGGIPLPKALSLCESLLGDDDRARLRQATALLREGRSLSHALEVTTLADAVTKGMLAVAERTGALSEILERVAEFKESRLQRSVDWTSRLIEPLLMIFIGLVIGAIVVMMYLPIFDLASSLQ
jgi:general secretion pathway protein F